MSYYNDYAWASRESHCPPCVCPTCPPCNCPPPQIIEKIVDRPVPQPYPVEVPGPERIVQVPGPERVVEVPGPERVVQVPGPERVVQQPMPFLLKPQCGPCGKRYFNYVPLMPGRSL